MNDYIKLLRRQVDEEITYLIKRGHDSTNPTKKCLFCYDFKGKNFCNRMQELREFQSQLAVHANYPTMQAIVPVESIGLSSPVESSELT